MEASPQRYGERYELDASTFFTSIRGLVLSCELTDAQQFDSVLATAQQEIALGRFIWPYFVAYGQRPTS